MGSVQMESGYCVYNYGFTHLFRKCDHALIFANKTFLTSLVLMRAQVKDYTMADSDRDEKRPASQAVDHRVDSDVAAEKRLIRKTDILMMPGLGMYSNTSRFSSIFLKLSLCQ